MDSRDRLVALLSTGTRGAPFGAEGPATISSENLRLTFDSAVSVSPGAADGMLSVRGLMDDEAEMDAILRMSVGESILNPFGLSRGCTWTYLANSRSWASANLSLPAALVLSPQPPSPSLSLTLTSRFISAFFPLSNSPSSFRAWSGNFAFISLSTAWAASEKFAWVTPASPFGPKTNGLGDATDGCGSAPGMVDVGDVDGIGGRGGTGGAARTGKGG